MLAKSNMQRILIATILFHLIIWSIYLNIGIFNTILVRLNSFSFLFKIVLNFRAQLRRVLAITWKLKFSKQFLITIRLIHFLRLVLLDVLSGSALSLQLLLSSLGAA